MLRRKVKDRALTQSGSSPKEDWENEQELQTYSSKKGRLLSEDVVAVEEQSTHAAHPESPAGSWNESEKELFETQIILLQEQLTASYVHNQELGEARRCHFNIHSMVE